MQCSGMRYDEARSTVALGRSVKFAIDQASKEAIKTIEQYAKDAFNREHNAGRILKEARALHTAMPRL